MILFDDTPYLFFCEAPPAGGETTHRTTTLPRTSVPPLTPETESRKGREEKERRPQCHEEGGPEHPRMTTWEIPEASDTNQHKAGKRYSKVPPAIRKPLPKASKGTSPTGGKTNRPPRQGSTEGRTRRPAQGLPRTNVGANRMADTRRPKVKRRKKGKKKMSLKRRRASMFQEL